MNKKLVSLFLVFLALGAVTAISGCVQGGQISSPEEAQDTLRNVSRDVGEVGDTLAEIDQSL